MREEDRVHAAERVTKDLSDIGLESAEKPLSKSSESFVDHLLAIPNVGNDADFECDQAIGKAARMVAADIVGRVQ